MSDDDIVWGATAIGKVINRNRRQTYKLLEGGKLPATKVGQTWVAARGYSRLHSRHLSAFMNPVFLSMVLVNFLSLNCASAASGRKEPGR